MSHKDENVVTAFFVNMSELYGSGTKYSRGKVHDFLGMDLDWSQDGVFIVSMIKYLQNIIDDCPEELRSARLHRQMATYSRSEMKKAGSYHQKSKYRLSAALLHSCYFCV